MDKNGFKVKKLVTLPLIKTVINEPLYVVFVSPMEQSVTTGQQKDGKDMEPATVAKVVNMETGEIGQIIIGTVTKSNFDENYPDHAYVGKFFEILITKREGKRYNDSSITELELPANFDFPSVA